MKCVHKILRCCQILYTALSCALPRVSGTTRFVIQGIHKRYVREGGMGFVCARNGSSYDGNLWLTGKAADKARLYACNKAHEICLLARVAS